MDARFFDGLKKRLQGEDLEAFLKIEARHQESLRQSEHNQVYLREFIVRQAGSYKSAPPQGEFDLDRIVHHARKDDLEHESKESLVSRILKQIELAAVPVVDVHLALHFTMTTFDAEQDYVYRRESNFYALRKDRLNYVARLSFHEFSFFPYAAQGPFAIQDFTLFLMNLGCQAKLYPRHFHLLLGTFPVANEGKAVSNMLVYVECGDKPRLTFVTKVASSSFDPEYPNTTQNFFFKTAIEEPMLELVDLKMRIQMASATAFEIENAGAFKGESWGRLKEGLERMGVELQRPGEIFSETEDGTGFLTVADICLDHEVQSAKVRLGRRLSEEASSEELLNPRLSQVLVSNTFVPLDESKVGRVLLHVDPGETLGSRDIHKGLVDFSDVFPYPGYYFGGKMELLAYDVFQLDTLKDQFELGSQNALRAGYNCLREFRKQKPALKDLIDRQLFLFLLSKSRELFETYKRDDRQRAQTFLALEKALETGEAYLPDLLAALATLQAYLERDVEKCLAPPLRRAFKFLRAMLEKEIKAKDRVQPLHLAIEDENVVSLSKKKLLLCGATPERFFQPLTRHEQRLTTQSTPPPRPQTLATP